MARLFARIELRGDPKEVYNKLHQALKAKNWLQTIETESGPFSAFTQRSPAAALGGLQPKPERNLPHATYQRKDIATTVDKQKLKDIAGELTRVAESVWNEGVIVLVVLAQDWELQETQPRAKGKLYGGR